MRHSELANPKDRLAATKLGKIRFLKAEGNYYEIGKAIGKKQEKEINYLLDRLVIKKELIESAQKVLPRHQEFFPDFVTELMGMADGANVGFIDLFAYNCFEYECSFKQRREKCTTVFWSDDRYAFIGHNEDGSAANYGKLLLVEADLNGQMSFISLNYPGLLCGDSTSVNSYGMVHSLDTLSPEEKYVPGFARSFIGRALLESRSIKRSREILSTFPNFEGFHFLIYSRKEHRAISIETCHDKLAEKELGEGAYAHSNQYLLSPFRAILRDFDRVSSFKVKRAEQLAGQLKKPSVENLQSILSDHTNSPIGICRHSKSDNPESTVTLASIIINLNNLSLYVANGNPCQNKYSRFTVLK